MLDRLAATSIRIDVDGPTCRQFLGRRRAEEHGQALPVDQEVVEA